MVWCNHCGKNVPGTRPADSALACNLCGKILENFNFSTEVKNVAVQSQVSGDMVSSVQSGISSAREGIISKARDELVNLRDALGLDQDRNDVIEIAIRFFMISLEDNITKGFRTELVQASCLYLTCREKKFPLLLIDFSSYLQVSIYELRSVYLQLCEMMYPVPNRNYVKKLVHPLMFIPRFLNSLLKGRHDQYVVRTARNIIASMKCDWIQTEEKLSGICGVAIYTAALAHGIVCSKKDIADIVYISEVTLTKRSIEYVSGSLNVDCDINTEEEKSYKKLIWEQMHKDYIKLSRICRKAC
ncbi:unnamed protein product [Eruca vesicaria subsp. sativa]|uniref:Cyclin-like domain-containing protein n=1 Tax=Eruca vesicaria subsp. sativa TaxID=29727 RepID=A0ABC8M4X4_ERUVS|nr:unnamed protein product [Eruca vesicaria subsp. sativa]